MISPEILSSLEKIKLENAVSMTDFRSRVVSDHRYLNRAEGPLFIHIGGASGSGKTTAARSLDSIGNNVVYFPMDNYMKGQTFVNHTTSTDPTSYGWDDPRNFDLETIQADLLKLKEIGTANAPLFNRMTSEREASQTCLVSVSSSSIVVVEGIHALSSKIKKLSDISAFVYTSLHDRLWRRAIRNTLFPGYNSNNLSNLLKNYLSRVERSYQVHVREHLLDADIVINNPCEPRNDFGPVLLNAPKIDPKLNYVSALVPNLDSGKLKPGEFIFLSRAADQPGDELLLHYIFDDKELLQYPIATDTLDLLRIYYDF